MSVAKILGGLILAVAGLVCGCEQWTSSDDKLHLTTVPGLAVPALSQLGEKVETGLRYRQPGSKLYVREGGKWVEVKPVPASRQFSAVVRSFDATKGVAYVELTYREYNMPLVQIWHFDGRAWSDSIDPGIFVR